MESILSKISEYRIALNRKTGSDIMILDENERIRIGNNISISSIAIRDTSDNCIVCCDRDGNEFGNINLQCLSDSILNKILNVLLKKM